jgi:type IV fimbrial biogenesis protein FimT
MKRYHGLTLIELMVTLAVAIVLLAVGIPLFQGMQERTRASGQANRLITAIQLARSEALTRGVPVSVCALQAPGSLVCSNDKDAWENGWQVFEDSGNSPNAIDAADPASPQIRVFEALEDNSAGLVVLGSRSALRFVSTGVLDEIEHAAIPAGGESVRFSYPNTGISDRCVTVSLAGSSRARKIKSSEACP